MKISIVIPTLNEEKYLPTLLQSIRVQAFSDYEVIVADAGSTDKTLEIARSFDARIVPGGLPARGRNSGAREARGDFLFFFDADVKLPPNFLDAAYHEMQTRYLDLATCEFYPMSEIGIDRVLHDLAVLSIKLSQYSNPRAPGFCILCTRRIFECAGGFDETLTMAEDHEFVKRASRLRPLRMLDSTYFYVSVRRMRKEGRFTLVKKYLQVEWYRFFKGELRDDILEYEFGNYADDQRADASGELERLDRGFFSISREFSTFLKKRRQLGDTVAINGIKDIEPFRKRFDQQTRKLLEYLKKAGSRMRPGR